MGENEPLECIHFCEMQFLMENILCWGDRTIWLKNQHDRKHLGGDGVYKVSCLFFIISLCSCVVTAWAGITVVIRPAVRKDKLWSLQEGHMQTLAPQVGRNMRRARLVDRIEEESKVGELRSK